MSGFGERVRIRLRVNGEAVEHEVDVRELLADFLRNTLGLTATRLACEHGVCGSCTVLIEGQSARSCLLLAVQADGMEIRTAEGLAEGDDWHPLQRAFHVHHAIQCGFCTSGFLMTGVDLLEHHAPPDEPSVRRALSGNLCRCTGYSGAVDALCSVLRGEL